MSKGSTPRPLSVGASTFDERWEATFGKKKPTYGHQGPCERIMADGKPCVLNAPCPDCGPSLIDYPEGEA